MERYRQTDDDFVALGLASGHGQPARMPRSHRHREIELNCVEEGAVCYLFGGRQVQLGVGQLAAFWAAIPHQIIDVEERALFAWLTIPLPIFLQWRLGESLTDRILHGQPVVTSDPAQARVDPPLFRQWHEDLVDGSSEHGRIVLLEVEARLRRLALTLTGRDEQISPTDGGRGPLGQDVLSAAERMASFIAEHYGEALRVRDIARDAGLHPNYAMSLFRGTFGMTLIEYLTQYRVAQAQRLLATSDDGVATIALDTGFGSISRFYTAFKQVCNQTPRQYRESVRRVGKN